MGWKNRLGLPLTFTSRQPKLLTTMNKKAPIRVMIVDNQALVRQGLSLMINIQSDVTVVAEASNGEEAVYLFQKHSPDITLIDLRLPMMDGVEAIELIRRINPQARIIALTSYQEDEDFYRAIKAGVRAYTLKGVRFEELLETIRAVHSGLLRIPAEMLKRLRERTAESELTKREMEVLQLIAKGFSNKEIGIKLGITENTVKAYIKNMLAKLNVTDRTQAIITANRRGIIRLT
jgi:two-component system, NarL family, response regulator